MPLPFPLVDDELSVLSSLLALEGLRILELGCGRAALARRLLQQRPRNTYVGLEVDRVQLRRNGQQTQAGMAFMAGSAQAIPFADAGFDLVLMLKSLHHVPVAEMDRALAEAARVLRPGGLLYVSEPVYEGSLNDIVKLYNDEGVVRAAAQAALDRAWQQGSWQGEQVRRFAMPVRFDSFAVFERRMMRPTFADHALDASLVARVRAAYMQHQRPEGAVFERPMLVRCLRRGP